MKKSVDITASILGIISIMTAFFDRPTGIFLMLLVIGIYVSAIANKLK